MPLYELFCLARPALPRAALAEVIEAAGRAVFAKGGVVTDIKSYGDRKLAYEIRKPGAKYEQAAMWQLSFMAHPGTLSDVEHNLKVEGTARR
ncbi:hypothetical protein WJX72_012124 [[Myrmecia] bisecta]|uniref:30S ribosomal protein S6 n=1 Tax=[Myrmecia] bisecta TaxID=41462 RepID=A0AAW1P8R9_9CHLO